jgi:hypothetical protein
MLFDPRYQLTKQVHPVDAHFFLSRFIYNCSLVDIHLK